MKAREIVIAHRVPAPPKERHGVSPFEEIGDMVVDCDMPGCGWHAQGTRANVKLALEEHRRMFHTGEILVVKLNNPLRSL